MGRNYILVAVFLLFSNHFVLAGEMKLVDLIEGPLKELCSAAKPSSNRNLEKFNQMLNVDDFKLILATYCPSLQATEESTVQNLAGEILLATETEYFNEALKADIPWDAKKSEFSRKPYEQLVNSIYEKWKSEPDLKKYMSLSWAETVLSLEVIRLEMKRGNVMDPVDMMLGAQKINREHKRGFTNTVYFKERLLYLEIVRAAEVAYLEAAATSKKLRAANLKAKGSGAILDWYAGKSGALNNYRRSWNPIEIEQLGRGVPLTIYSRAKSLIETNKKD